MKKSIVRHKNLAIKHSEEAGNRKEELVLKHLCPECGGPLTPDLNEVVCRKCGVIASETSDEPGPEEPKQISAIRYNRRIEQELKRLEEARKAIEADLQSLECQRVCSQEVKCRRCGRYIPYRRRGRKPESCVACKPIIANLRRKEWAERIPDEKKDKLREKSKLCMRNRRLKQKLSKDTDLARIDLSPERQKKYQRHSARDVNNFINI